MVSCLLRHGAAASINAVSARGDTFLSRAAAAGSTGLIHVLVSHGARVAGVGTEPLVAALRSGHSEAALSLIKYGADCAAEGGAPLLEAARHGLEAVVRALLDGGASCLAADAAGCTALHFAAAAGSAPVIALLCARGARVNDAATRRVSAAHVVAGTTPLMLASRSGSVEAARALASRGCDARAKDSEGWTALDYAKRSKMRRCIRALMGEGGSESESE
jgi:ankyrin repeat protein